MHRAVRARGHPPSNKAASQATCLRRAKGGGPLQSHSIFGWGWGAGAVLRHKLLRGRKGGRAGHRAIADINHARQYPQMENNLLHIRPAEHGDLLALIDLYQHLNHGDEQPTDDCATDIFERLQRVEGSAIFIGEMGAILAASCTLVVIPNLTRGGRPYGLIENVVTHSDFRNRGLGKRLLDAASRAAWRAGCYKVMLMTGSKQHETLNFYLSAGFEQSKSGFQKRNDARFP